MSKMDCKHLPGIQVTYCTLCDVGPYKGQFEQALVDQGITNDTDIVDCNPL